MISCASEVVSLGRTKSARRKGGQFAEWTSFVESVLLKRCMQGRSEETPVRGQHLCFKGAQTMASQWRGSTGMLVATGIRQGRVPPWSEGHWRGQHGYARGYRYNGKAVCHLAPKVTVDDMQFGACAKQDNWAVVNARPRPVGGSRGLALDVVLGGRGSWPRPGSRCGARSQLLRFGAQLYCGHPQCAHRQGYLALPKQS